MPHAVLARRIVLAVALVVPAAPALAGDNPITRAVSKLQARNLSGQDTQFLELAAQGGETQMADATLALKNASAPAVKSYAKKMLADFTAADGTLADLAKRKGFMLPSDIGTANKTDKGRLERLHGAAFDRTYLATQTSSHAMLASVYAKEAASGKDGDVVGFAKQTLPQLRAHLALARSSAPSTPR